MEDLVYTSKYTYSGQGSIYLGGVVCASGPVAVVAVLLQQEHSTAVCLSICLCVISGISDDLSNMVHRCPLTDSFQQAIMGHDPRVMPHTYPPTTAAVEGRIR